MSADMDALVEAIAAHGLYAGWSEDDPQECGCGLVEPREVFEANDPTIVMRWWASHVVEAIGSPALLAAKLAVAWDEGWDERAKYGQRWMVPTNFPDLNPYRAAVTGGAR